MRGRDEDTGEFRGESRSQQRREALEVLSLGEKLVALTPAQLAKLPVPESLIPHIEEAKRITAHIAHKRQLAFLAKQMRREDEAVLEAIREAMDVNSDSARREVAAMHRVEDWRERLLADGDSALTELLNDHPDADRQRLRQLIRNAKEERLKNKPPHAYRELFRELRELILGAASAMGNGESGVEQADDDEALDDTRD
ncbi:MULTISPECIES: ribosome biogenesis factor YjgA [Xanthomonas]|uniref:Dual-action ribosomal maturation protein DarP n=1 Tax=Xanthomonas rydalmerensis TaxID=3046274 RepID=A0ABZ0JII4_9XANT|nr:MULTISPECIES: ribosome biogenesis factor YjgA [unclassified Xanthomonas]MBB5878019.1 ribosome-associated protein [Xanthomonas sp. 3498]WOS39602.1 ribosome biogenesis factor YjgA [Xanthomonas sp. DM-2023]WOS43786.1 ribosome biogenesis factor YjgA [Xanthomonas sp. DM-2023]WOS47966.1 ribosome biogenesis factor YjgA [Xanthomonas sp. DM-2023]WOS52145.1 ribosome biogenesis factor YjgA [Xanthomonas sp. DM-2023]